MGFHQVHSVSDDWYIDRDAPVGAQNIRDNDLIEKALVFQLDYLARFHAIGNVGPHGDATLAHFGGKI